ncbi:hypothetical protein IPA_00105 [Ignicoccus pacificus DSM 13166]|uniref:Uncharacterized protein n=1 Tax=Ignicoccus pacificus DSM 13166 TaxID=940294 RepID=A0A977KAA4_9CREN|nr:hypothetical protein IPA_00105 [Ignicoccus pacificus DSM 13166]
MIELNVSIKHVQCGAKVMVVKDFDLELPTTMERFGEICKYFKCDESNDPCDALIRVMSGTNVIITRNEEVKKVISLIKSMIAIGRAFQLVDDYCRRTQYGLVRLKELELHCPDYSYPRALFIIDELSPSMKFLEEALKRASMLNEEEKVVVSCDIEVPKSLRYAYPFSQMECPDQTKERIKRNVYM